MPRALALAALALLALGCDQGPSEPNRSFSLIGTVEKDKPVVSEVVMNETGNLRATTVKAELVAADGAVSETTVVLTLGDRSATVCTATGAFSLVRGSSISLGLDEGSYCFTFAAGGTLDEGAKVNYQLDVEITE